MVSRKGFEPPTAALEGHCSIQLSYRDIQFSMEQVNYTIVFDSFQEFFNINSHLLVRNQRLRQHF